MAVKVQFEIGHTAKLRSKKTPEGFTHDWELYVRGVNKSDITTFVDKVVFNLHDSFPKPKRVCKDSPYLIQESGYAGFLLPIDIYFRNRDEPKRFQFTYDLDLQQTGPPHHRTEVQTFIFENPSEELRQKLLKGGGVPVAGVLSGGGGINSSGAGGVPDEGMVSKPKLSTSGDLSGSKKHKSRSDDTKISTYATLFGTPITKTKHSPDAKNSNVVPKAGGGHTPTTLANSTSAAAAKEKSSKEKEKALGVAVVPATTGSSGGAVEKVKDKSERKEKYKVSSPHKEPRSDGKKSTSAGGLEGIKHEKRSEEKSKKNKSRDNERERSREKGNNIGSAKRPLSPKSIARDMSGSSPKRQATPPVRLSSSGRAEENKVAVSKMDPDLKTKELPTKTKEQGSSSSGKKSKKDKKDKDKDKDKDRDKEKRDENKEKHRNVEGKAKEDRISSGNSSSTALNLNSNNMAGGTAAAAAAASAGVGPNDMAQVSVAAGDAKDLKTMTALANNMGTGSNNKKAEKVESKQADSAKAKSSDKSSAKDARSTSTPLSSLNHVSVEKKPALTQNAPEKDKKSHKHKKKDRNKERDRDKEKYKEKAKEKEKERDKVDEKLHEKSMDASVPKSKVPPDPNRTEIPPSNNASAPASAPNSSSTSSVASVSAASKKSQSKEKRARDKASRDEKRLSDGTEAEQKNNKHSKNTVASGTKHTPISTSTSSSTSSTNNNLDLSDGDSLHSVPDAGGAMKHANSNKTTAPAAIQQHSDSSNSSFLDLPAKASSLLPPPQAPSIKQAAASSSKEAKSSASVDGKEMKQRLGEKKAAVDKADARADREEKKRRRNSMATSAAGNNNTFIEPPLKQLKKDQTKTAREKSKSPSLRSSNGGRSSAGGGTIGPGSEMGNPGFLPPPANATGTSIASSPASSTATPSANSNALAPPSLHPASPALATDAVSNAATASSGAATVTASATATTTPNSALPIDYLSELQELHHKIMTLQDNGELQQVVELIAATGCYEITSKTFDFDLCKLDRTTVQRLQEFFATSVS